MELVEARKSVQENTRSIELSAVEPGWNQKVSRGARQEMSGGRNQVKRCGTRCARQKKRRVRVGLLGCPPGIEVDRREQVEEELGDRVQRLEEKMKEMN